MKRVLRPHLIVLLCSTAMLLYSCTKDKIPAPVISTTVSFSKDIYPVFASSGNCGNTTCHGADVDSRLPHMYSLDSCYTSLLRDTSTNLAGYAFVDTLNPANSFVYIKLTSENPPDGGVRMPNGGPYLSNEFTEKVLKWIQQGAPKN
jgi:hypothetical protein